MSRLVGLTLAVLTLAGSGAWAQEVPPEATDVRGNRLLWIEPLGTVVGLAYTAAQTGVEGELDERILMISGGYAHPLDARRSLATELFVAQEVVGCRDAMQECSGTTIVRASVGMAYSFGGSPGRGFLLQPRLILGYLLDHAGREGPSFPPRQTAAAHGLTLQAGLDVGYQWRVGPVYLSLVGGVAAGVASPLTASSALRQLKPALGLNLHLLRLGFAF
ncbi:MAG TPA: hypothetical protein VEY88_15450 [Archangium sp.]|nr:hypothetical protein [Archangium sp.]